MKSKAKGKPSDLELLLGVLKVVVAQQAELTALVADTASEVYAIKSSVAAAADAKPAASGAPWAVPSTTAAATPPPPRNR